MVRIFRFIFSFYVIIIHVVSFITTIHVKEVTFKMMYFLYMSVI